MKNVFQVVVKDLEGPLREAGFSIKKISEYAVVLSQSNFLVHASVERYYPSSISIYISTPASNRYEVGTLEEIIDPHWREAHLRELAEARANFRLNEPDLYAAHMEDNLRAYLKLQLTKIVEFFMAYRHIVFDVNESYRPSYLIRSNEELVKIVRYKTQD